MKKPAGLLLLFSFSFFINAYSQDFGYKTIDLGGEYMGSAKGSLLALHFAYNFKIHNAVQARIGYYKSDWKSDGKHAIEKGNGPGFSLGYRYYFLVRPHGAFLGARADFARLNIDWQQGLVTGNSKIWALRPTLELGYMFLINDQVFISPCISAGIQQNIQTTGQPVGDGFIPLFGLSAGWKF